MRWHPVSGEYPMMYEMEIGRKAMGDESYACTDIPHRLPIPYYVEAFWNEPGCFRVRGVNKRGAGDWSEYRYFAVTVIDDRSRR
jgi:hypothetical protein